MSELSKVLVHEDLALPLLCDIGCDNDAWFRRTVDYARQNITGFAKGEYTFPLDETLPEDLCALRGDITLNYSQADEKKMLSRLEAGDESLAACYIRAYFAQDKVEQQIALEEWVCESVKQTLVKLTEMWEDTHFNDSRVITQCVMTATKKLTIYVFQIEFRGDSRPVDPEDARTLFVNRTAEIANYWGKTSDSPEEAAIGAIGSLLRVIDGADERYPGMKLTLTATEDDKSISIDSGDDFFVPHQLINDGVELLPLFQEREVTDGEET